MDTDRPLTDLPDTDQPVTTTLNPGYTVTIRGATPVVGQRGPTPAEQ